MKPITSKQIINFIMFIKYIAILLGSIATLNIVYIWHKVQLIHVQSIALMITCLILMSFIIAIQRDLKCNNELK